MATEKELVDEGKIPSSTDCNLCPKLSELQSDCLPNTAASPSDERNLPLKRTRNKVALLDVCLFHVA